MTRIYTPSEQEIVDRIKAGEVLNYTATGGFRLNGPNYNQPVHQGVAKRMVSKGYVRSIVPASDKPWSRYRDFELVKEESI